MMTCCKNVNKKGLNTTRSAAMQLERYLVQRNASFVLNLKPVLIVHFC